jgi:poly-gamma-glutamate synthesis protein (capsule biosynthesis protein)
VLFAAPSPGPDGDEAASPAKTTTSSSTSGTEEPPATRPSADPATTTQPTSTTLAATTTEPPRTRLVISGAGDTNLDPDYIPAFRSEGYELAFSGLDGIFLDDDLTIVNLECAASALGARVEKEFNFNCDVDALPVMLEYGVEVANLANNHAADYGEEALLDTKVNVAEAGVAPVGVGVDAAEAHEPALFEVNGWTIAVLGFGGVIPWADWVATDDDPGMADGDTIATMVAAVEAADQVADLVFVSVHWGVELDTTPRPDDVERAHAMIDAGADGIFGHHSHRLQPLDTYEGKPVAWGLGNFVWPRLSPAGATSAIAQFVVEPDGSTTACLIPVIIESSGHPVVQGDYRGPCAWTGTDGAPAGPLAPPGGDDQ